MKNSKEKKKEKYNIKRISSIILGFSMIICILGGCSKKDKQETTASVSESKTDVVNSSESNNIYGDIKLIDLSKHKLKDDKNIYDITKLVKKSSKKKNETLVDACAMSYMIGPSRVARLLYECKKDGIINKYIARDFLVDEGKMDTSEISFAVKNGAGGGLKVVSLEDMIFCDAYNKYIYAPEIYDKPVDYSKYPNAEVFAYVGKPFLFNESTMGFYEVNSKRKVVENFKLNSKYSSAKLVSTNKLEYVQIDAVSPYESKKIYMDIDPDSDDGVINKYTMKEFDEYFEEYSNEKYYELDYDKNNDPVIYLYDKQASIRIKKNIPNSIKKKCNNSSKYVYLGDDAICDKIIFLSVKDDNKLEHLYIWNLKHGKTSKYKFTAKNPFEFSDKKIEPDGLRKKADMIEDKYGFELYIGNKVRTDFGEYDAKKCTDNAQIKEGLEDFESLLNMYPDDFFKQLKTNEITNIKVYLTGEISSDGSENTIENPAAMVYREGDTNNMIIDVSMYMNKEVVSHEITHMIDFKLSLEGYLTEEAWNKLNPSGFKYRDRYVDENGRGDFDSITGEYTYVAADFGEENLNNVYFFDDYAKTYSTEDRARMMELLMSDYYDDNNFFQCSHVLDKLKAYFKMIDECFDTSGWGTTVWEERLNELSAQQNAA